MRVLTCDYKKPHLVEAFAAFFLTIFRRVLTVRRKFG